MAVVNLPLVDSTDPAILRVKAELDAGRVPAEFAALQADLVAALRVPLAECDVLIAHNVISLNKNLPLAAALHTLTRPTGAPGLILWHHDIAAATPRYRDELHPGAPWTLVTEPWPWAIQVTISAARRDELAALYAIPPEEIEVVPNGVDARAFLALDPQADALADRLGLRRAAPLLLLPVRLTPRKNVELALRVLASLRTRMPEAALVVTGPLGPHNPANRAYFTTLLALRAELGIELQAHFLAEEIEGYASDALVASLYRMADALLFPSREEGFGIPVLEAGLARIPAFCADIPPLRAIGGDDATWFSPDAPPEEVARQIAERLLSTPEYRLAVRARAYTWQRIYAESIAPLVERAAGNVHSSKETS